MIFSCRQCIIPTGVMSFEEAVDHLIEKHPNRAATFIKKLVDNRASWSIDQVWDELDRALSNRTEYPNQYGTYE